MGLTRREVLIAGLGIAAVGCTSGDDGDASATAEPDPATDASTTAPTTAAPTTTTAPAPVVPPAFARDENPFTLGVGSGDPDETSVVLWTRLLGGQEALEADYFVAVDVSLDAEFTDLVSSELAEAPFEYGNSVHYIAENLDPDSWYWYRFRIGEEVSATGRTRTMPSDDTPMRLGFSSCQHWETGAYAAHRHLASADLDISVWLGDYIYETGAAFFGVVTSQGERTHDGPEIETLEAYRARYGLYKSDIHLQAHHAARPWVVTWDDHEVQNNYAAGVSAAGQDAATFAERQIAARQAWWEHMPVRLDPPEGDGLVIHRSVRWGTLVDLHMLDGRQYRDPQPTDGEPVELPGVGNLGLRRLGPTARDESHSMLGSEQRQWLEAQVAGSTTTWNVLGNQVFMHGLNAFPGDSAATNTDTWDGYFGERQALLGTLAESTSNLIILSGDFHASSTADVRADPFALETPIVATEFMAPAISSLFPSGLTSIAPLVLGFNPQIVHFEPRNGFMTCEVTPETWTTTLHVLDDVTNENSELSVAGEFTVRAGTPGIDDFSVS